MKQKYCVLLLMMCCIAQEGCQLNIDDIRRQINGGDESKSNENLSYLSNQNDHYDVKVEGKSDRINRSNFHYNDQKQIQSAFSVMPKYQYKAVSSSNKNLINPFEVNNDTSASQIRKFPEVDSLEKIYFFTNKTENNNRTSDVDTYSSCNLHDAYRRNLRDNLTREFPKGKDIDSAIEHVMNAINTNGLPGISDNVSQDIINKIHPSSTKTNENFTNNNPLLGANRYYDVLNRLYNNSVMAQTYLDLIENFPENTSFNELVPDIYNDLNLNQVKLNYECTTKFQSGYSPSKNSVINFFSQIQSNLMNHINQPKTMNLTQLNKTFNVSDPLLMNNLFKDLMKYTSNTKPLKNNNVHEFVKDNMSKMVEGYEENFNMLSQGIKPSYDISLQNISSIVLNDGVFNVTPGFRYPITNQGQLFQNANILNTHMKNRFIRQRPSRSHIDLLPYITEKPTSFNTHLNYADNLSHMNEKINISMGYDNIKTKLKDLIMPLKNIRPKYNNSEMIWNYILPPNFDTHMINDANEIEMRVVDDVNGDDGLKPELDLDENQLPKIIKSEAKSKLHRVSLSRNWNIPFRGLTDVVGNKDSNENRESIVGDENATAVIEFIM